MNATNDYETGTVQVGSTTYEARRYTDGTVRILDDGMWLGSTERVAAKFRTTTDTKTDKNA